MTILYDRIILKYELQPGTTVVSVPLGAETLTAQVQDGQVVVWLMGATQDPREERRFLAFPTGVEFKIGPHARYVGTVQIPAVIPLVFHIFEERVF